jgi:hypothetical protein
MRNLTFFGPDFRDSAIIAPLVKKSGCRRRVRDAAA